MTDAHKALPSNHFLAMLADNFTSRRDGAFCHIIDNVGEMTLTWADLERGARRFTGLYSANGILPGGVVLIFLRHGPALYGAFFGAMLGGFVPSFMPCLSPRQNPAIYWRSHQTLLDRSEPSAIVADRATFAEMEAAGLRLGAARRLIVEDLATAAAADFDPPPETAIALLQHSSGTTGLKKGVALSYDAILRQIESYRAALHVGGDDVIVSWLPLYHDMGLIACCVMPAILGVPVVHIDPFYWVARPRSLFDAIAAHRGTLAWLPNFAFEHLARVAGRDAASFDLSRVRAFVNCSEPCKPATFDRFRAAFAASGMRDAALQCCYAMAETVFAVTQTTPGAAPRRIRVASDSVARGQTPRLVDSGGVELIETGAPLDGVTITIRDDAGNTLPEGAVGEIAISAPFLFAGYDRDSARTAERLIDGVYFSRDLGFLRDGHLFVLGRADDLIIVNGRNLYAHDIEAAIGAIAGIKPGRCIAIGVFDEIAGSDVLIVVCERDGAAARDPDAMIGDIVAAVHSIFAVTPRRVHVVAEGWLVKTTSGKLSRNDNLARLAGKRTDGSGL